MNEVPGSTGTQVPSEDKEVEKSGGEEKLTEAVNSCKDRIFKVVLVGGRLQDSALM